MLVKVHYSVLRFLLTLVLCILISACGKHATQGAGRGATTGVVAGAVGGLVSGLVFGGDPLKQAARGAVVGGAVGATTGAMSGSRLDTQEEQQQAKQDQQRQASNAALRSRIGDDAYDGLGALAECKYDISLREARKAKQSSNPNFALAGLWLEVLSYADKGNETKVRSLLPVVVAKDWNIESEAKAETVIHQALEDLMDIRQDYNLPRVCSGSYS
jgi:Sec-independent protein translocase protein TatA